VCTTSIAINEYLTTSCINICFLIVHELRSGVLLLLAIMRSSVQHSQEFFFIFIFLLRQFITCRCLVFRLGLKQISKFSGYPFEIYYPNSESKALRIVASRIFTLS